MLYLESLEAVIKVLAELRIFSLSRRQRRDRIFNAVEAIRRAANQTKFYYANLRGTVEEPNMQLSEAWMNAATAVRDIDNNLYERLFLKADFWANPSEWTAEQSAQNNIYLDSIIEDADRILNQ
ncbi:MAG: hypothetical protein M1480_03135 [Bacteroidetes bacterium]|nr:hypothetical protein [Bacteroidota bacterium]MCL5027994.1 hypothetical protein [Bacteroidota bacterium]